MPVNQQGPPETRLPHVHLGPLPGLERHDDDLEAQPPELVLVPSQLRQVLLAGQSAEVAVEDHQQPVAAKLIETTNGTRSVLQRERDSRQPDVALHLAPSTAPSDVAGLVALSGCLPMSASLVTSLNSQPCVRPGPVTSSVVARATAGTAIQPLAVLGRTLYAGLTAFGVGGAKLLTAEGDTLRALAGWPTGDSVDRLAVYHGGIRREAFPVFTMPSSPGRRGASRSRAPPDPKPAAPRARRRQAC